MKCRICDQEIKGPSRDAHHLEQSPIGADMCLGCWMGAHNLEMFLSRGTGRSIMGDWTAGWLREILKDPRRYL